MNFVPLNDAIRPTTFIRSSKLNDFFNLDITIATETFQHTGSFKFRAAYNLASSIPNRAILTASSGNFGQALAYACKILDKQCTVVMPTTSAIVKVDAVRSFGATVELVDTTKIGRNERVEQLARAMPEAYVASAYDDNFVIDGNATLGVELAAHKFDAVVIPVGGGGLISGIITGLNRTDSRCEVFAAEPSMANDGARSFREGRLIPNDAEPMTIADGARTISLGKQNWPIIKSGVRDFIEVSEEQIAAAVRTFFQLANLKCEPTGALSLGAVASAPEYFPDKKICVVVTGGNVDPEVYKKLV